MNFMKKLQLCAWFLTVAINIAAAAESDPPASPEVTAAMKPYLNGYKLAGVISLIADKSGKVHYKNLLGYADVEAKKPITEDNVFWIASMTKMTNFIPQLSKWIVVAEKYDAHLLLKPL